MRSRPALGPLSRASRGRYFAAQRSRCGCPAALTPNVWMGVSVENRRFVDRD